MSARPQTSVIEGAGTSSVPEVTSANDERTSGSGQKNINQGLVVVANCVATAGSMDNAPQRSWPIISLRLHIETQRRKSELEMN